MFLSWIHVLDWCDILSFTATGHYPDFIILVVWKSASKFFTERATWTAFVPTWSWTLSLTLMFPLGDNQFCPCWFETCVCALIQAPTTAQRASSLAEASVHVSLMASYLLGGMKPTRWDHTHLVAWILLGGIIPTWWHHIYVNLSISVMAMVAQIVSLTYDTDWLEYKHYIQSPQKSISDTFEGSHGPQNQRQ